METQNNISPCKKYIIIFFFKKNPLKENKILQDIYYNSIITNLKVSTQAKNPHIKKNEKRPIIIIIIIILPWGPKSLKLLYTLE